MPRPGLVDEEDAVLERIGLRVKEAGLMGDQEHQRLVAGLAKGVMTQFDWIGLVERAIDRKRKGGQDGNNQGRN